MQNHFLDVLEDEEIRSIRAHCQDNYRQIYVDKGGNGTEHGYIKMIK